tara:strand:- start:5871 stop:6926 length:1056 start_codon:yes stop_codon:yes gene_type:complete
MRRNAGKIGLKHSLTGVAETNSTSGIFDLFDQRMYYEKWPTTKKYISCTESTSTVSEGASMSFAIVTAGFADGTTLYYTFNTVSGTAMTDADLTGGGSVSGGFTLSSNAATLNFSFLAEVGGLSESNVFKLEIRSGSTGGTVEMESGNVTVTDAVGTDVDIYVDLKENRNGIHIGTIYHYVVDTSGNILHTFGTTGGNYNSTSWISVSWSSNAYAITPGTEFRFAWKHDSGYSSGYGWRGDYAIDNVQYYNDGSLTTTYGFETNSAGGGYGGWIEAGTTNTSNITTAFANSTQINTTTSTGAGRWNVDQSGTPSSGTGPNSAYSGTYFIYSETSSSGQNTNHWVFSELITA